MKKQWSYWGDCNVLERLLNRYKITYLLDSLYLKGKLVRGAEIYEAPLCEVTFENLSEKGKLKALELGYAPAVNLDQFNEDGYWRQPDSETAVWKHAFRIKGFCPTCDRYTLYELDDFEGRRCANYACPKYAEVQDG